MFLLLVRFKYLFLALIVLLAAVLRFYQLGYNPPSLDWDEASIGYNAYSLLKTGADEYGNKLPLAIRSFDDYKPPVYIYLTVPSIAIFGLSEWSIKLPAALTGVGLVVAVYFLVDQYLKKKNVALLAAFFVAISPWSLQFSRAAFEANAGIFFFILGIAFFRKHLFLSALALILSAYSYHSFRVLVPAFMVLAVVFWWKELLKVKVWAILSFLIVGLSFIPIATSVTARPAMVTIFNVPQVLTESIAKTSLDESRGDKLGVLLNNRRFVYAASVAKGYLDHFDFSFLFLTGDGGRQHHAVDMGMLYLVEFIFIVAGIIYLISHQSKGGLLFLILFALAPLPSALTTGTPHPVRAMGMMPFFHIFAALGVMVLVNKKVVKILVAGVLAVNCFYYLHQYYIHTPVEYGDFWQYGYKELYRYLATIDRNYSKVVVTYRYDQPYIYYLLYNKVDPKTYQQQWLSPNQPYYARMFRKIGKYDFRDVTWGQDESLKNALVVGTPDEIPAGDKHIIKEIKYLNGVVAFRICALN